MEYQLLLNDEIHDHWRCTDCKETYLMSDGDIHTCYRNIKHRLHRLNIKTINMYYINRLIVCTNCKFMGRVETYKNLVCPCCANKPMTPLKELMQL